MTRYAFRILTFLCFVACQGQSESETKGSMLRIEDHWVAFWAEDDVNIIVKECATFVDNERFQALLEAAQASGNPVSKASIFKDVCQTKANGKFGQTTVFEQDFRNALISIAGGDIQGFNNPAIAEVQANFTKVGPGRSAVAKQEAEASRLNSKISEAQGTVETLGSELTRMETEFAEIVGVTNFTMLEQGVIEEIDATQNNKYSRKQVQQTTLKQEIEKDKQSLAALPIDVAARTAEYDLYEAAMNKIIDTVMNEITDQQDPNGNLVVLRKHSKFSQFKQDDSNSGNHIFILLSTLLATHGNNWKQLGQPQRNISENKAKAGSPLSQLEERWIETTASASKNPNSSASRKVEGNSDNSWIINPSGARYKLGAILRNTDNDSGVYIEKTLADSCSNLAKQGTIITAFAGYKIRHLQDFQFALLKVESPLQPATFDTGKTERICLDPADKFYRNLPISKWFIGFRFVHSLNTLRHEGEAEVLMTIKIVEPNSPSAAAGLQIDDQLLWCKYGLANDTLYQLHSIVDLHQCLIGADGKQFSMAVRQPDGNERILLFTANRSKS